jgi:outer membrane murein-binding lipoprotein Lpp
MDQIVAAVAGLTKQVGQLADQVKELRERQKG